MGLIVTNVNNRLRGAAMDGFRVKHSEQNKSTMYSTRFNKPDSLGHTAFSYIVFFKFSYIFLLKNNFYYMMFCKLIIHRKGINQQKI